MSQIQVKFDNTLKKSEIIVPLISSSKNEGGESYNNEYTEIAQTSIFGIKSPLISINSTVIDFDSIYSFSLNSNGVLPELNMIVEDKYELINYIDKPGIDNEVRLQILPKFDNIYKKIDLTFYISNISVNGSLIKLSCIYKSPELMSYKLESLGKINTYNLFKNAALESHLGFASNVEEGDDKRFIYFDNKSWLDLLKTEINYSGKDYQILDWWVDLWDNINLVDMYERYNAKDSDEDMLIWVATQINDTSADTEIPYIQIPATIHNHPGHSNTELVYTNCESITKPGTSVSQGSDKVYSIYIDNNDEYLDYLIQDGDIQKDIFVKHEYLGESYGEYNYLLQKHIRQGFLQKINSECLKVTLPTPVLGLIRGNKVNFIKYTNNSILENKIKTLEEAGVVDRNIESNINLSDYELHTNDSYNYEIDRTTSGQYLINGVNINYSNSTGWSYILNLIRPADIKPNILKEE